MTQSHDRDPHRGDKTTGAYSIGEKKKRAGWLLPLLLLLALIVLGLLLWAFLANRGDKDKTAAAATPTPAASISPSLVPTTPATPSVPATPSTPATPSAAPTAGGGATAGRLLAGTTSVLPLRSGSLARYAGRPASAKGVPVQSLPADEGFWVGISTTDRVWVQTGKAGETAYKVQPGDRISFTGGRVVANEKDFAQDAGVTPAEGARQLSLQKQHIEVPKSALHLSNS